MSLCKQKGWKNKLTLKDAGFADGSEKEEGEENSSGDEGRWK